MLFQPFLEREAAVGFSFVLAKENSQSTDRKIQLKLTYPFSCFSLNLDLQKKEEKKKRKLVKFRDHFIRENLHCHFIFQVDNGCICGPAAAQEWSQLRAETQISEHHRVVGVGRDL